MKRKNKLGLNLFRLCTERDLGMTDEAWKGSPTIYSIAKQSKIAETTLRELAEGESSPTLETLRKLGEYLGLKVGDLLVELTK